MGAAEGKILGNADGPFVGPEGFAVGKDVGADVLRGSELHGITSTRRPHATAVPSEVNNI